MYMYMAPDHDSTIIFNHTCTGETMNAHFRDTVFGQMIRLLSQNRFLKFPDELDRSLSERCTRNSGSTTQSLRIESGNIGEHDKVVEEGDAGGKAEAGKSVCLVDWYDLNDPEVSFHLTLIVMVLTIEESTKLVLGI